MEQPIVKNSIDQINSDEFKAMMGYFISKLLFYSENDKEKNYYHEYCKLFVANIVLTQQLKDIIKEKTDLKNKLNQLETKRYSQAGTLKQEDEKTKRFRRQAAEIERHYKCPYPSCSKVYGAEGSLNQHIRLKHPDYTPGSQEQQEEKEQN